MRRWPAALVAVILVAPGAASGERGAAGLEEVGPVRPPAYVRSNELADVDAARFKSAPGHQAARPGDGRRIHLDPSRKAYLWVIDASGTFHVAPYEERDDGSENIGHPMLIGGGGARMAGELHFVRRKKSGKDVWELDSDSGRYVKPYPDVTPEQLAAARRLIKQISITSGEEGKKARPVKLRARFVEPGSHRPDMRRVFALARRTGGYVLLPPKGMTRTALPARLRGAKARAAWQRAARARLAPAH
ncbi:MAG TPA: hypothetical protein VFU21_23340 [Kofleriaceae bacterium]|nr:hypothetical protein [Kofleriaceae bacterium]